MEIIWLVSLIIIPLFAFAIVVLYRQTRSAGSGPQSLGRQTDGDAAEQRRRLPHGLGPMGLVLAATVVVAIVLALFVGFPLLRTLLIAFNAPLDAD